MTLRLLIAAIVQEACYNEPQMWAIIKANSAVAKDISGGWN